MANSAIEPNSGKLDGETPPGNNDSTDIISKIIPEGDNGPGKTIVPTDSQDGVAAG